jgi:hypothetical protein
MLNRATSGAIMLVPPIALRPYVVAIGIMAAAHRDGGALAPRCEPRASIRPRRCASSRSQRSKPHQSVHAPLSFYVT